MVTLLKKHSSSGKLLLLLDNNDHVEVEPENESPTKPKKKPHRLSVGGHTKEDWTLCMEGFADLPVTTALAEDSKRSKKRKRVSDALKEAKEIKEIEGNSETPYSSQVIADFPSDEEPQETSNSNNVHLQEFDPHGITCPQSPVTSKNSSKFKLQPEITGKTVSRKPQTKKRQKKTRTDSSTHGCSSWMSKDKSASSKENMELPPDLPSPTLRISQASSPSLISPEKEESPELDVATNKQRSSDWVRNIKWQMVTPDKSEHMTKEVSPDDSAKKKKAKFIKEGLADRLNKLALREKTATTFWAHKLSSGKIQQDSSRILSLEIVSLEPEGSLVLLTCCSSDDKLVSEQRVLFSKSHVKQLALKPGTHIKLHPPWQTLQFPGGGEAILCTHFCQVVAHASSDQQKSGELVESVTEVATWSCPCRKEKTMRASECPAQLLPSTTTIASQKHHSENSSSSPKQGHLVTVCCSPIVSSNSCSNSILGSIERSGGCAAVGVSFVATIQRICCKTLLHSTTNAGTTFKKAATEKDQPVARSRWSFLLQDGHGTMCELALPERCENKLPWSDLVHNGEGKTCRLSGLRVQQRLIRARMPALFSMLESLWKPSAIPLRELNSQDSQLSAGISSSQCAGFCYALSSLHGESNCDAVDRSDVSMPYSSTSVTRLADICDDFSTERFTFCVRLIYVQHSQKSGELAWYVIDTSLCWSYVRVRVHANCHLSPDVHRELARSRPLLILKDACCELGKVYVDGYSRVFPAGTDDTRHKVTVTLSQLQETDIIDISLPQLSCATHIKEQNLFCVSGSIMEVDEATAYSWLVCNKCQGDRLNEPTNISPVYYCLHCEEIISAPITKIRLDVFLRCELGITLGQPKVKVKLLQSTIESLLPDQADDEGYDIQCVLSKRVEPLHCFVESITRDKSQGIITAVCLKEIQSLS